MREDVLRELAARAASDPVFLSGIRRDPERTLLTHGYELTPEELKTVQDLRRRTSLLGDSTLAALLAGGLEGRGGGPPVRPAAPDGPGRGPARPGSPGGARRKSAGGDQPG